MLIPRGVFLSMIRCAAMPLESDLYAPVKALLEGQGYVVKGEVRGCDVVALRCAELLASNGPMKLAALRAAADAPRAATILQQDVYGWFERVERGIYTISPAGRRGLEMFARP